MAYCKKCNKIMFLVFVIASFLSVFPNARAASVVKTAHLNQTLVSVGNTVYYTFGGERFGIPAPSVLFSYGYNFDKVIPANDFDKAMPINTQSSLSYADGTIVMVGKEISIVTFPGERRAFATSQAFTGLGYDFKKSHIVIPEPEYIATFNAYYKGEPITSANDAHPEGALININGTIYQSLRGKLYGIPNPEVFNSRGFRWENVVAANAADKLLPIEPFGSFQFSGGTLVRDTFDGKTVYVISGEKKFGIASPSAFMSFGYQWKNVVNGSLLGYPDGGIVFDDFIDYICR
ncbi:MAG: hypothetical protein V1698_00600 [bacterium]